MAAATAVEDLPPKDMIDAHPDLSCCPTMNGRADDVHPAHQPEYIQQAVARMNLLTFS
jgi:hypothetical protein